MPLLGPAGSASYLLPVAVEAHGGPEFPGGAFDKQECREEFIQVPFAGKMPLIPPPGSLPPDVSEVLAWRVSPGMGTAHVRRCGRRRRCLESLYDRASGTWYCGRLGEPCGESGEPACVAVDPSQYYTWTEDFVQGQRKVSADEAGNPIFPPAASPTAADVGGALAASGYGLPLVLGGAALLLLLLSRR